MMMMMTICRERIRPCCNSMPIALSKKEKEKEEEVERKKETKKERKIKKREKFTSAQFEQI